MLYISTSAPLSSLIEIVRYIMTVYVPIWFKVKKNSSFTEGAKHLFEMLRLSQTLSKKSKTIVSKVLQRNAFFAHHENILVSMIHDEEKHIRQQGDGEEPSKQDHSIYLMRDLDAKLYQS